MNIFDYKWWWSKIGGRPWTYIIRDAREKYPTPWMLVVMVASATIGHYFWGHALFIFFGALLVGILWGHLWWNEGQGLAPNDKTKPSK